MSTQPMFVKKALSFIVSIILTAHSFAMDETEHNGSVALFQGAASYLLHIGFPKGLPEDGIMRPGRSDAANYFSLNGTLPSNDHMPQLDTSPYVVILKLTDMILSRIVGFHVTEVLLAGEIDLKDEEGVIIAPKCAKIPSLLKDKIVPYEGKGLLNRNKRAAEYLEGVGAYPVYLEEKITNGHRTWDNLTIATTTINGNSINVNKEGRSLYFSHILDLLSGISYTCPAGAYDGIGHLSNLKWAITNKNQLEIQERQKQLIAWVGTLTHLDDGARIDFIERINTLPQSKQSMEYCIIS